jgi:hypothetical protein
MFNFLVEVMLHSTVFFLSSAESVFQYNVFLQHVATVVRPIPSRNLFVLNFLDARLQSFQSTEQLVLIREVSIIEV